MLTVIPWFVARRARKSLSQLVATLLTDRPTLLAVVTDKYTNEHNIRPFVTLAERFGGRLHVIVFAEYSQLDREREGEPMLRDLGVNVEGRRRLLRDDEDPLRIAVLLRQKQPVGLIETFFVERAERGLDGEPDPRGEEMKAREDAVVRAIEETLVRLPPPAPPAPRILAPGEHDFAANGLCQRCGEGKASFKLCPGTKRDEGPKRDRFELIELD